MPPLQRAPLDVYKKITIIRNSTDSVVYEDSEGKMQRITDLGDAALAAAPTLQTKVKHDIPVPTINDVDDYDMNVSASYSIPHSYVRYKRPTDEEINQNIEYNIDYEDEKWLQDHPLFGPNGTKEASLDSLNNEVDASIESLKLENKSIKNNEKEDKTLLDGEIAGLSAKVNFLDNDESESQSRSLLPQAQRKKPSLPLLTFEHMLDVLEKATSFDTIITLSQAERLILGKIPQLLQIFGSSGGLNGPSSMKACKPIFTQQVKRKKNLITVRAVISGVYNYWVQKRSKLKKPLLRRYWPVTSSNDTNPHLVFRPREKEKYKLRKKRQNDLEAYRKLQQLRTDFSKVRVLLELVKRRERLNKAIIYMQSEWFDQYLYDLIDTSGIPRGSDCLSHDKLNQLLKIPKYFDTRNVDRVGKRKKRKRGSAINAGSRSSPTPISGGVGKKNDLYHTNTTKATPSTQHEVATQDNPPMFLNHLASRDSYVTSWKNAVPSVTSYVNAHPTPTSRFRHRPRIGRGGRVVIDRFPCPGNPVKTFTTGIDLPTHAEEINPTSKLLDILPKVIDHQAMSRRIEEICASVLSEDERITNSHAKVGSSAQETSNTVGESDDNDGENVIVKVSDWLETDEQLWGEEQFVIGPI